MRTEKQKSYLQRTSSGLAARTRTTQIADEARHWVHLAPSWKIGWRRKLDTARRTTMATGRKFSAVDLPPGRLAEPATPEKFARESVRGAVLRDNPNRGVQRYCVSHLHSPRRLEKDRELLQVHPGFNPRPSQGHRPTSSLGPKPKLKDAESLPGWVKSRRLSIKRVIDEFGEIQARQRSLRLAATTLGDAARIERLLAIGRVAPEIEGDDLDGKRFKLTDFRGKVVVLNFWSHVGCAICRDAYPAERALVKRMEGKPFVMPQGESTTATSPRRCGSSMRRSRGHLAVLGGRRGYLRGKDPQELERPALAHDRRPRPQGEGHPLTKVS